MSFEFRVELAVYHLHYNTNNQFLENETLAFRKKDQRRYFTHKQPHAS